MRIAQQLNFDVTGFFHKFFDEDTVIAKTVSRFVAA
jgi:hypothetical protein